MSVLRNEMGVLGGLRSGRPRAVYVGFLGYDNLGDEALFRAHQQLFAGIHLTPYRKSRLLGLLHHVARRPAYDFGILGGGTLIGQHHRWLDAVQRLQKLGVPMVCLGTGVASPAFWELEHRDVAYLGHVPDEISEWVKALEQFVYVGVRGPESRRQLAAWGFDDADIGGDPALSLGPVSVPGGRPENRGVVGINVTGVRGDPMWGDPKAYLEEMSRFVSLLCESGHRVRLVPTAKSDLSSTYAVVGGSRHSECEVIRAFGNHAEYGRAVSECDVFVGQRLHSTVIACIQGVPSLMIEYRPKCRDFMASLGLEKYTVRTDEFTAEIGMTMVDDLTRHRTEVVAQLDHSVTNFRRRQSAAASTLIRHFASWPSG